MDWVNGKRKFQKIRIGVGEPSGGLDNNPAAIGRIFEPEEEWLENQRNLVSPALFLNLAGNSFLGGCERMVGVEGQQQLCARSTAGDRGLDGPAFENFGRGRTRITEVALGLECSQEAHALRQHAGVDDLRNRVFRLEHHTGCQVGHGTDQFDLERCELSGIEPKRIFGSQERAQRISMIDGEDPEEAVVIAYRIKCHGLTFGRSQPRASQSSSIQVYASWKQGGVTRAPSTNSPAR